MSQPLKADFAFAIGEKVYLVTDEPTAIRPARPCLVHAHAPLVGANGGDNYYVLFVHGHGLLHQVPEEAITRQRPEMRKLTDEEVEEHARLDTASHQLMQKLKQAEKAKAERSWRDLVTAGEFQQLKQQTMAEIAAEKAAEREKQSSGRTPEQDELLREMARQSGRGSGKSRMGLHAALAPLSDEQKVATLRKMAEQLGPEGAEVEGIPEALREYEERQKSEGEEQQEATDAAEEFARIYRGMPMGGKVAVRRVLQHWGYSLPDSSPPSQPSQDS